MSARQYRKRMPLAQYFRDGKQYFALDQGTVRQRRRRGRAFAAGLLLACGLLLLVGRRVSWRFRQQACS